MTDREKLIELLRTVDNMRYMRQGIGECADYILADGWIRPPCKVGDTVYYLSGKYEKQGRKKVYVEFVDKAEVDNIVIGQKGVPQIDVCNSENEWTMFDSEDDLGKIVFIGDKAKEEAEKALAKRNCDIAQNIESCEDCGFCEKRGASDG